MKTEVYQLPYAPPPGAKAALVPVEAKPWPRKPTHLVTTDGRIFGSRGKELKQTRYRGYMTCSIRLNGAKAARSFPVHRIVLETFVGDRPEGMQCRHLNGDAFDNRLENLCWGTPKENTADSINHGAHPSGEGHKHAKLTAADVAMIRAHYIKGSRAWGAGALARRLGVGESQILRIVRRQSWKHLQ